VVSCLVLSELPRPVLDRSWNLPVGVVSCLVLSELPEPPASPPRPPAGCEPLLRCVTPSSRETAKAAHRLLAGWSLAPDKKV